MKGQRRFVISCSVFLIWALLGSGAAGSPAEGHSVDASGLAACRASSSPEERTMEQRLFAAINAERAGRGLHRLLWSEAVARAAREHSCRMVALHYFSHDDPEKGSMPERLARAGIAFSASSENIRRDRGHPDPVRRAVGRWMMSLEHRAAILDRDYDQTGVGIARASDGTWYFTQIFIAALAAGRGR